MNKKEKLGITLMVIGHIIAFLMVFDVLAVIGDILDLFFGISINVRLLNSWEFRLTGLVLYGILFLTGGLIYKKNSSD